MVLLAYFVYILLLLLSIAFFTLFERKVLSLSQIRMGPYKNFMFGVLQPLLDGVKLLFKEVILPKKSNFLLLYYRAIFMFLLIVLFNISISIYTSFFFLKFFFLFLILIFGITVYPLLLLGWSSFSKYGMLGAIRSCAQSISYEICLRLLIITIFFNNNNPMFLNIKYVDIFINFLIYFVIFICLVVETNRPPFDFREGESELIAGFSVELSRHIFVFIFLGEYGIIIFSSFMLTILFLKGSIAIFIWNLFIFIILRSSLPRFRYDILIYFLWVNLLVFLCILLYIVLLF